MIDAPEPDEPGDAAAEDAAAGPVPPGLYIASTPIGAARDVTLRALDLLAACDVVAAEDTRTARRLMDIHGIALGGRRLVSFHDHSGEGAAEALVERIAAGASVVYVSEAGTPLVSDPGYALVRAALARGVAVRAAPGPSALLAALAVSGLPTDRFLFAGFLPAAGPARRGALQELAPVPATLVLYESPRRARDLLADAASVLGPRPAALCRELTKRFEEVRRGTLPDLLAGLDVPPRGEVVLVVGRGEARAAGEDEVRARLAEALATMRVKDAATVVAGALGLPRAEVYRVALTMRSGA